MDKKTLLAVVLSVVIIVGGMMVQQALFPPTQVRVPPAAAKTTEGQAVGTRNGKQEESPAAGNRTAEAVAPGKIVPAPLPAERQAGPTFITRETDLFRLTLSRDGGVVTSIQLKKFKNVDGSLVEMVLSKDTGQYPFDVSFGDYQGEKTAALFDLKETVDQDSSTFEFSRTFLSPSGIPFTLRKTYLFFADEYMMELKVSVENSVNDYLKLGSGPYAYSLSFGPQIGPLFGKLDGKNEYRSFVYFSEGKRKDLGNLSGNVKEFAERMTWAGIMGKYFTVIVAPDATQYRLAFDARKLTPKFDRSTLYLQRPEIKSARSQDVYRFYIGPKKREILSRYNDTGKNRFGIADLRIDEAVTSPILIGWLAQLLKWLLELFYLIVPNYGVAIILLTLFTKVIFLPLTFKSSEATARMQALNPKMAEIRARLKDKPEKLNQEIAELYRREKVNPLSGCLPMLLQLPIFFALYSLLNDYFDLRGSAFIPGWMSDLSAPESIWDFAPFTLPIVGWHNLRALPFLMLATQFIQTKFTTPQQDASQGAQMKLFSYVMPAFFFFILYDMPSGLVLYWTVQNILSVFQQLYINSVNKKKKELAVKVEPVNTRRR